MLRPIGRRAAPGICSPIPIDRLVGPYGGPEAGKHLDPGQHHLDAVQPDNDSDRRHSQDWGLSLTLTWNLADLAYHPELIDVSRETRALIEFRDDVLDEITQLYFERRRVLVEIDASRDRATRARLRLRADELAAGIDAWTDGWFSQQMLPPAP